MSGSMMGAIRCQRRVRSGSGRTAGRCSMANWGHPMDYKDDPEGAVKAIPALQKSRRGRTE